MKSFVDSDSRGVGASYNRPGMYAVIKSGGKQTKVAEGMTVSLELLDGSVGQEVEFTPVMVVDGESVHVGSDDLASAKVVGVIKDEIKGPKVIGFRYKSKANERKRFGHRQRYHRVEITGISLVAKAAKPKATRTRTAKASPAKAAGVIEQTEPVAEFQTPEVSETTE